MKNTLCIAEWQRFGVEDIEKVLYLSINKDTESTQNMTKEVENKIKKKAEKYFNELVEFIKQEGNDRFLGFVNAKKLKAKNHVGLIQTKSGFSLEILPKTFKANQNEGFEVANCTCANNQQISNTQDSSENKADKCKVCQAKDILLNMLKTLKDSPFKQSHLSNLERKNLPLLEVFIIMFITELERLVKRGIKSDYLAIEENRRFLKGKLLFKENLKYNLAHKERFYTLADEWSMAIAQNRLIVSTLNLLSTQSLSLKTSARLNQLRFIFEGISPSKNIESDFAKCHNSRHFEAYKLIMLWCEIFLKRKVFSPYKGNSIAFALLFPMETLFESYVASGIRKYCKGLSIKAQESKKYLCIYEENDKFLLKPDIVGYKDKEAIFIADSKWKILDSESKNYGIAQSDFYQLFAYLAKYKVQKGYLIYPKIEVDFSELDFTFKPEMPHKATLKIKFFPLESNDKENEKIAEFIEELKTELESKASNSNYTNQTK